MKQYNNVNLYSENSKTNVMIDDIVINGVQSINIHQDLKTSHPVVTIKFLCELNNKDHTEKI